MTRCACVCKNNSGQNKMGTSPVKPFRVTTYLGFLLHSLHYNDHHGLRPDASVQVSAHHLVLA